MSSKFDLEDTLTKVAEHRRLEGIRRGNTPKLAKDVKLLRLQHRTGSLRGDTEIIQDGDNTAEVTVNHEVSVSKAPLESLNRISITDLRMERATKGGYLTLRTLEEAFFSYDIQTIVEDHKGNAVLFCVYNFTEDKNPILNDILPIGTTFILKEPYIRISFGKTCTLRCDCPSDMIIVYKGHDSYPLIEGIEWINTIDPTVVDPMFQSPVPQNAMEWKERGNAMFRDKKFHYATRCYLQSLKDLPGTGNVGNLKLVLFLNISETYLKQGFFENGLEYAIKVLKTDHGNEKALYRAGKCCYQLRKYREAKKHFFECNTLYPGNEDVKKEIKKVNERLEEVEGRYDMPKMFEIQFSDSLEKIDCADYTGPIKLVEIQGKGRGYVATKDIEPGTLLMVSKALVFDWVPETLHRYNVNYDNSYNAGSGSVNLAQLAQIITKNFKTFAPSVYDLYDGHISATKGPPTLFCKPETKEEPVVDMLRIRNILLHNSFDNCYINRKAFQHFREGKGQVGGGLFILPSYFNHSCIPNVNYHIFNGVMMLRTMQYIKAGEEVFVSYYNWDTDYKSRLDMCRRRHFKCDCRFCFDDMNTPDDILAKREDIYTRFHQVYITKKKNGDPNVIRKFNSLIGELNETYKHCSFISLNTKLLNMYNIIAEEYAYCAPPKFDKIVQTQYDFLKVFGVDAQQMLKNIDKGKTFIGSNAFIAVEVVDTVVCLIYSLHVSKQDALKNKWIIILRSLEYIYIGGDLDLLRRRYCFKRELMAAIESAKDVREQLKKTSISMTSS